MKSKKADLLKMRTMMSRLQRLPALCSLLLQLLVLLTTTSYPLVVEGFVSSSSSATKTSRPPHHHAAGPFAVTAAATARKGLLPSISSSSSSKRVVRLDRSSKLYADPSGQQRGAVILPLVLLLCIWMFSIPPEFRRAKICTTTQEQSSNINYPARQPNCMTGQQWMTGVQEYYQNGGGIHFDFSIDPATLADNEELLRNSWFSTTTKK
jgi:hypothetical protein